MIYISSQALSNSSRASVMQAQSSLAKVQQELSSGKLADIGLGLGPGSGQLVSFEQQESRLQSIKDANALSSARLSATASGLDSLQASASSFLAALTASLSAGSNLSSVAGTAQSNLGAMISTLNTAVSGQYIFGGINSSSAPVTAYTASPPSANKLAVDAAFSAAFGVSQNSAAAGSISASNMQGFLDTSFSSLFGPSGFDADWSNASDQPMTSQISISETIDTSVSANASAFRKLAQAYTMVAEFTGTNLGRPAAQAVVSSATKLVSSALTELTSLGATVGTAQASISDSNDRMASQIALFSSQINSLQGIDSYGLATQVSGLQAQIQASYELTSQLQQLSLVSFIK